MNSQRDYDRPEPETGLPDNPAWEALARQTLEESGYDADLAIRVSRDALLVLRGELPEEEFRERHQREYVSQFGCDDRPPLSAAIGDGTPSPVASQASLTAGEERRIIDPSGAGRGSASADPMLRPGLLSRRTALRMAGGGVTALFLGQMLTDWLRAAPPASGDGPHNASHGGVAAGATEEAPANGRPKGVQMGMVIDTEKCDGCLMCVGACRQAYSLSDGVFWIYVMAYKEPEEAAVHLLPRICNHCSKAPCVMVCPVGARHKREDGLVLTDYDKCIGCRYCQVSCPYGVNYFQWADPESYGGGYKGERRDARGRSVVGDPPRGVMGKCTFCPLKQDSHHERATTHCSLACPMNVLHYGDLNDPNSEPNRYLAMRREENGGKLPTFRLLEDLGTKPNVIYIGHPPSRQAKPTEGPVRYEDWGFVEERRAVLDGPKPWFLRMVGK